MGSVKRSIQAHKSPTGSGKSAEMRPSAQKRDLLAGDEAAESVRSDDGKSRLVERPDGVYWQDEFSAKLYGPFPNLADAMQDMLYREDSSYEEGESLQEAEAEIGIADWVDPETGELAEGLTPHRGSD